MKQQTLGSTVELSGRGLHTDAEVRMILRPGKVGQGIVFRRSDLDGHPGPFFFLTYLLGMHALLVYLLCARTCGHDGDLGGSRK